MKRINTMQKQAVPISRVLTHLNSKNPCAVISAYVGDQFSPEENQERHEQLQRELNSLGFKGFIQLRSQWDTPSGPEREESLLVPNLPMETAISLGQQFEQYSINES